MFSCRERLSGPGGFGIEIEIGGCFEAGCDHAGQARAAGEDLYVNSGDARSAALEGGSFNVIHVTSGGKVDVFVSPPGDEFRQSRVHAVSIARNERQLDFVETPSFDFEGGTLYLGVWPDEGRDEEFSISVEVIPSELDGPIVATQPAE